MRYVTPAVPGVINVTVAIFVIIPFLMGDPAPAVQGVINVTVTIFDTIPFLMKDPAPTVTLITAVKKENLCFFKVINVTVGAFLHINNKRMLKKHTL